MISVSEAYDIVLSTAQQFGSETVLIQDSIGRILAEDIMADRPFPPFDRVTMDGVAIRFDSFDDPDQAYIIESVAPAGSIQRVLHDPMKCIEVMTGSVLPKGTDTVIRYEDLIIHDNSCKIQSIVRKGQNVHAMGTDHPVDDILLSSGHQIKAIDINILATVGKSSVKVTKAPSIAILSSGDELVPVVSNPLPYQIRMSNVHMLKSRLKELGIVGDHFHINDDQSEIKDTLMELIAKYDVLLLSGGVSKGKYDFIPHALTSLGVECLFHRVLQRPGKPLWFGKNKDFTVFAFPGNPVSTLSCFHKYFVPWLSASIGQKYIIPKVVLRYDVEFKPDLTFFAQAQVEFEDGKLFADISKGNGSGDMIHPAMMDGFVELPQGKSVYKSGEVYSFIPFYSLLK
jgi:molybdopterin molybdotransferase